MPEEAVERAVTPAAVFLILSSQAKKDAESKDVEMKDAKEAGKEDKKAPPTLNPKLRPPQTHPSPNAQNEHLKP